MRFDLNPTFSIETGERLYSDATFYLEDSEVPIRCDRSVQKSAKSNASTAGNIAGSAGANADQVGSSFIPGLERQASNPTGFTPTQKNNMLVGGAEAVGGSNAGLTGDANLSSARTRSAGGYAPALAEAARMKARQLSTNALNVNNADAMQAQENQRYAQQALQGLYGTDTSKQLQAMGLQNEDMNTALRAGQSGWLQNTLGTIGALSGAAQGAAGLHKSFA